MPKIHTILTPHNPILISKISRKNSEKVGASIEAMKKLREKIYEIKPSKIFIITDSCYESKKIVINQSENYTVNFKEFGNLSMQFELSGDLDYSTKLKYYLKNNNFDANLFSDKNIDHHTFVMLYYLNQFHTSSMGFENELKIDGCSKSEFIILHSGENDLNYHKKFGELFCNFLKESKEKIFIIISGDFTKKSNKKHSSNKEEFSKFSYKIIDLFKEKKYDEIIEIEELKNSYYPWIKPFAMASEIIKLSKSKPSILALDKEFGETYLTMDFN